MNTEKIMFLNLALISRDYRARMDTPKLSLAAQRVEDAKMGRKLVERAEAQLSASLDKGRRANSDGLQLNKGQHVNIRT